ncbi:hypothetical protein HDU97_000636 [Phlyctochytrium planicorne]|nr:hypothetical protein HDU97_000636 [Phlyctochytrium planicorne]
MLLAEVARLKHNLLAGKSQNKKLEAQNRLLNRKKDALAESLRGLKKDVRSERDARFVVERYLQEKMKKMELDLEFKENEIFELRDRERELMDEIECKTYFDNGKDRQSPQSNTIKPIVGRSPFDSDGFENLTQAKGKEDDEDEVDAEDEEDSIRFEETSSSTSPTPPLATPKRTSIEAEEGYGSEESSDAFPHSATLCRGISFSMPSSENFLPIAREKILQELVSDASPSTILVDLDDLAASHGVSNKEVLTAVLEALVRFIEIRSFGLGQKQLKIGDAVDRILSKYWKLIAGSVDNADDELHLLRALSLACQSQASRIPMYKLIVMGLYRHELIQPESVLRWWQETNTGERDIRTQCSSFVTWLQSQLEEESEEEEEIFQIDSAAKHSTESEDGSDWDDDESEDYDAGGSENDEEEGQEDEGEDDDEDNDDAQNEDEAEANFLSKVPPLSVTSSLDDLEEGSLGSLSGIGLECHTDRFSYETTDVVVSPTMVDPRGGVFGLESPLSTKQTESERERLVAKATPDLNSPTMMSNGPIRIVPISTSDPVVVVTPECSTPDIGLTSASLPLLMALPSGHPHVGRGHSSAGVIGTALLLDNSDRGRQSGSIKSSWTKGCYLCQNHLGGTEAFQGDDEGSPTSCTCQYRYHQTSDPVLQFPSKPSSRSPSPRHSRSKRISVAAGSAARSRSASSASQSSWNAAKKVTFSEVVGVVGVVGAEGRDG